MSLQHDQRSICYFNGEIRPAIEAAIPVNDLGFIHGVTVSEQIRTFNGQPFLVAEHLQRFQRGLDLLGIRLPQQSELSDRVCEVADRNRKLLDPKIEQGICLFATPGASSRFALDQSVPTKSGPTVCIHSYVLPHVELRERYQDGVKLKIATQCEVPSGSFPKDVKIRSRLHYFLADLEIKSHAPDCMAILTDSNCNNDLRNFRETSTATPMFIFNRNEIAIPPAAEILSSVSLDFAIAIARELGFKVVRREISVAEIDQVLAISLVSTPFCICDVAEIEGKALRRNSDEQSELKTRWKQIVGFDFESNKMLPTR